MDVIPHSSNRSMLVFFIVIIQYLAFFKITIVFYIVKDLDESLLYDRVGESIGLIFQVSTILLFLGISISIKKALDAELRHDSLK